MVLVTGDCVHAYPLDEGFDNEGEAIGAHYTGPTLFEWPTSPLRHRQKRG